MNHANRIASIDIARGIVMLLMTVDHVRETFFLQHQVGDPMDVTATDPALFLSRIAAHFCAPMFVFLTGLSAWLYAHPSTGPRDATGFLVKRGLLLVGLELTLVNFAWTGSFTPATLYLQVIWAIGLAMLALALLHKLPLAVLGVLGAVIVAGHNALQFAPAPGTLGAAAWTILEQRGFLFEGPLRVRISYPLLAWVGVILLGYAAGPLYARTTSVALRRRWLLSIGAGSLALLAVLRGMNGYGEPVPWSAHADPLLTAMSFFNFTKYPPSLGFLLLTLGVGLLVLALVERPMRWTAVPAVFGGAPMFYYLLHLYALLALQRCAAALLDVPRADFGHVWQVWLASVLLAAALYWPTRWFAHYKRTSGKAWVRYF
ncbi:DUF1624 domain-containing protein [Pseudoduganella lutea]|uniref:DUF1624 domain-containing protein n=1 Tax=Pseudoduganella lutea TaxID=321985 RepID=A0A4P6L3N1_9BURK|nr:heparan-alpha-glucosaminide N-acetyltransferase domain-containing protein [Pseudoduganella lutea]QBE66109.1 DUF1624 domain-containing protein [Pseudoduganella lutea]